MVICKCDSLLLSRGTPLQSGVRYISSIFLTTSTEGHYYYRERDHDDDGCSRGMMIKQDLSEIILFFLLGHHNNHIFIHVEPSIKSFCTFFSCWLKIGFVRDGDEADYDNALISSSWRMALVVHDEEDVISFTILPIPVFLSGTQTVSFYIFRVPLKKCIFMSALESHISHLHTKRNDFFISGEAIKSSKKMKRERNESLKCWAYLITLVMLHCIIPDEDYEDYYGMMLCMMTSPFHGLFHSLVFIFYHDYDLRIAVISFSDLLFGRSNCVHSF